MQIIDESKLELFPGDIVVYNATKGGWFSTAQRFFTRKRRTHTSVVIAPVYGNDSVIEAAEVVTITPFVNTLADKTVEFWVYRIEGIANGALAELLDKLYTQFAGNTYGYLQLIYFVRRWIWETKWVKKLFGWLPKLLGKPADVRQWNNYFVSGTICSELVHWFMTQAAMQAGDLKWVDTLNEWNSNNFHSGDVDEVCVRVPRIKLIYKAELNNVFLFN